MIKRLLAFTVMSVIVCLPSVAQTIRVGPDATYPKLAQAAVEQLRAAASASDISLTLAENQVFYGSAAVVSLSVTNLTDKIISGIKIYGQSIDIFGHPFENFGFEYDKNISPNESKAVESIQGQRRILKANQAKTKHHIQPIHIVFEDGSELKDPNPPIKNSKQQKRCTWYLKVERFKT